MSHFIGASDCCGPKADQSTGWQFESPTASKSDASGPEQVSGAIVAAPPCKLSSKFQFFNPRTQAIDLIDFFSVTS